MIRRLLTLMLLAASAALAQDFTPTANLGLKKPNVGSTNWGIYVNQDFDTLDAAIGVFKGGFVNVPFSATPVFDMTHGNTFQIVLSGNVTSSTVNQPFIQPGQLMYLIVCQDGTGNRTFTFPASFQTPVPSLTLTASKCTDTTWQWNGSIWISAGGGGGGGSPANPNNSLQKNAGGSFGASSIVDNGTTITTSEPLVVNGNFSVTGTTSLFPVLTVPNGGTGDSTFTTNGILYGNSTGPVLVTAAGGAGTLCVVETNGGPPTLAACSGSSSTSWSSLTNPSTNLGPLTMGANTTVLQWNAATGANVSLFSLTDTTNNTGNGYMLDINLASGSVLKPARMATNGNGVNVTSAGLLAKVGTGGLDYGSLLNFPAACGANLFATQVAATPGCTQPAFTNISGTAAATQGGTGLPSPTAHSLLVTEGASAFSLVTSPSVNGFYACGFNVTTSVAIDPTCGLQGVPVLTPSTPYTGVFSDRATIQRLAGGTTFTWNLPQVTGNTASNMPIGFLNNNSGALSITANGADKINGSGLGGTYTAPTASFTLLYQDASSAPGNWWPATMPQLTAFPNCNSASSAIQFTTSTLLFSCGTISGGGTPCTTTALSLQYDNAGAFGCLAEFTYASSTITSNSSGKIDLSSASATAGLRLPSAAGAAPTADGFIATNTTTHATAWGSNGTTIVGAAAATGTGSSTNCTGTGQVVSIISAIAAPTCGAPTLDAVLNPLNNASFTFLATEGLTIAGTQPASVSGAGTAGGTLVSITAPQGGNSTTTTGGAGANIQLQVSTGGNSAAATPNAAAGNFIFIGANTGTGGFGTGVPTQFQFRMSGLASNGVGWGGTNSAPSCCTGLFATNTDSTASNTLNRFSPPLGLQSHMIESNTDTIVSYAINMNPAQPGSGSLTAINTNNPDITILHEIISQQPGNIFEEFQHGGFGFRCFGSSPGVCGGANIFSAGASLGIGDPVYLAGQINFQTANVGAGNVDLQFLGHGNSGTKAGCAGDDNKNTNGTWVWCKFMVNDSGGNIADGTVVKMSTNADKIVPVTTTDPASSVVGIVVVPQGGNCASAATCAVAYAGTLRGVVKMGTASCAIGNGVAPDTTTGGEVKCLGSGIGPSFAIAESVQATPGNTVDLFLTIGDSQNNLTRSGPVHQTAQTGAISTATLCAALTDGCGAAGMYHIHFSFIETGTACGTPATGGVTFLLTWTDTNGTAHSAVSLGMDDASAINAVSQTFHFQSTLAAAWASGDFNVSTNGSVIQYATGYTACGVGTGTYQLDAVATKLQ